MKALSLFSNIGIAEIFLEKNNINVVLANELIQKRCDFYKINYPFVEMICGDIQEWEVKNQIIEKSKRNNCEFIIAAPPCQGMSVAGKMKKYDKRNRLILDTIEIIEKVNPKFALIENVPALLKTKVFYQNRELKIIDIIKNKLKSYFINYEIVDCANYGTPQTRKRAIILLSKLKKWEFPEKERKISVREAISHLPSLESEEKSKIPLHNAKKHSLNHILWLKHTPTGKTAFENEIHFPQKNGRKIKGYSTTYKRIEWDKPAPTITMSNGAISSQNNVHAGRLKKDGTYSDARVLTIKELLLLSGIPNNFKIDLKNFSENFIRQVIGEGIPPNLIDRLVKKLGAKI